MEVELLEIRDFLSEHPPFDQLPQETLSELTPKLSIRYLRRGREFPPEDGDLETVYLVRQGAISLFDKRRKLMESWATYATAPTGKVVKMGRKRRA